MKIQLKTNLLMALLREVVVKIQGEEVI